jgi:hypothetical protein
VYTLDVSHLLHKNLSAISTSVVEGTLILTKSANELFKMLALHYFILYLMFKNIYHEITQLVLLGITIPKKFK